MQQPNYIYNRLIGGLCSTPFRLFNITLPIQDCRLVMFLLRFWTKLYYHYYYGRRRGSWKFLTNDNIRNSEYFTEPRDAFKFVSMAVYLFIYKLSHVMLSANHSWLGHHTTNSSVQLPGIEWSVPVSALHMIMSRQRKVGKQSIITSSHKGSD